jgi:two-component system LytT family response regulator
MSGAIPAFVVDDEPLARARLLHLLRAHNEIQVVGAFGSAAEAASCAAELAPQLILLDIRMPEQDGFELVSSLTERGIYPYVIFVTAHSDRTLDAFSVGAIDYLLKPFDEERFARAVDRAKTLITSGSGRGLPPLPAATLASRSRLLLYERGKVVVLPTRDIEFVQAAARHVKIYAAGHCYTFRHPLADIERRLDPALFVRVHRSTLVNIEHIVEMHPLFHGDQELVLKRGTRLTLSRRYRARLAPFLIE